MNLFIIIIISVMWGMKGRQAGRITWVVGKWNIFQDYMCPSLLDELEIREAPAGDLPVLQGATSQPDVAIGTRFLPSVMATDCSVLGARSAHTDTVSSGREQQGAGSRGGGCTQISS